jgi:hypothetical protein
MSDILKVKEICDWCLDRSFRGSKFCLVMYEAWFAKRGEKNDGCELLERKIPASIRNHINDIEGPRE